MTDAESAAHARTARSILVGRFAAGAGPAGAVLFDAGGKAVLGESTRTTARRVLRGSVQRVLEGTLPGVARFLPKPSAAAMTAGSAAVRTASLAGRASAASALIDGGFAAWQGAVGVSKGEMTTFEAGVHVAKEAGTGAAAGAAGVGLAVGAVALLGPLGPGVLFGVGALGSLGTKIALTAAVS